MTPRILVPDGWQPSLPTGRIELATAALHHLTVVLRRQAGDPVELFDGDGRSIAAVLEAVTADATPRGSGQGRERRSSGAGGRRARDRDAPLGARLVGPERIEPPPALTIALAQGISSNERMDWTIEKAVEAGVDRIVALQASRSASRGAPHQLDARRSAHWERIIASACAQCGRNRLARLEDLRPTRDWLAAQAAATAGPTSGPTESPTASPAASAGAPGSVDAQRFLLSPDAQTSLSQALKQSSAPQTVWVACGPEAGFDAGEAQQFVEAGWTPVTIGPRTLRTETAALMAVAIIQSQWGDLR